MWEHIWIFIPNMEFLCLTLWQEEVCTDANDTDANDNDDDKA